jgi:hypothetical protein
MISEKALVLARRRDALVVRIAVERAAIAQNAASLGRFVRLIDKISDVLQYIRRHPATMLLPIVLTAVSWRLRLFTLAVSGFGLWQMARNWRRRILS